MSNLVHKVAAGVISFSMVLGLVAVPATSQAALTQSQINSILSLLQSFGADQSTINNVNASLLGQPTTTGGGMTGGTTTSSCTFTRDLTLGATGADVTCLQNVLMAAGYTIPSIASGAAQPGYFGAQTQAALAAWQKAVNITPSAGYFGPKSRAALATSGGTTGGGTTGGGTPVTGNGLKVMLAAGSPNNVALVQGQAIGLLALFEFQNPTASEVSVTGLNFKRIGVSNDETLANVYIYDGATRLLDSAAVSNASFNYSDSAGIFKIPAGGKKTIAVRSDIAGSTSGQQVGVQLVAVTSAAALDSSVSLPINGGIHTVSAATLATVDFNTSTSPTTSALDPQNDYTLWQNTVSISTNPVHLESITFENMGSSNPEDFKNLRLYVDGTQVGTTVSQLDANDKVTFDLSSAPKRLETGGRVIKVVGDVVGGSGDTVQLSLRRSSDARFVDTQLNQPVLVTTNGSTFSARSATSATVNSGTVSVVRATNSPTSNVSLNGTNVKFATFEMRASGEDVEVDNLSVRSITSVTGRGLDNGKVFLNGVQIGSTKDLTGGGTDVNFTFGSSFVLKQGETAIVDIYADAKSTTGAAFLNGETAQIQLSAGSSNGEGRSSKSTSNVPSSAVTGNALTISSSSLTATKFSGYGNQTIIAGTNNARIGSFTLSTGSTEAVNVNTIRVDLSSDNAASLTDIRLVDNATGAQIGTTRATPSTENSFAVNFNISASATKTIDVIANIKSGANAGTIAATVDSTTGGTGSTTGNSVTTTSDVGLQTITIGSGVLTVALNAGSTPDNSNVIAGSSEVKVGSFRFTSQFSSYTVQELKVEVPTDAATSVSSVILKYKDSAGVDKTASQALTVPTSAGETHATATFTGLTFFVPQNTDRDLDVYVSIPTIANGASTGKAVSVALADGANSGFKAIDSSGSTDTTLTGSGRVASTGTAGKGTKYVRKSVPVLSKVALDTTTLTAGANKALGRVKITADTAGDVGWKKLVFAVNKTAAVTLGATTTLALWDGANQVAGTFATTTGNHPQVDSLLGLTSGNLIFEATSEQQIAAGSSKTYEVRGTIGGITTGYFFVNLSVANPSTSVSTAAYATLHTAVGDSSESFIWTDRSSINTVHSESTTDWTNDFLVDDLILDLGTMSVSI